ncbi:C39 family peptidase [Lactobacillus sp. Marseille-P7033]|nr:C39 family peptidase [Lactobacillus sp. Marseille-P7033]NGC77341.1 hypothetical protein [Limosilactobacillus reuteri]
MGKSHYKMYKKGKNWCYMAIATLAVAVGVLSVSQGVSADATNSIANTTSVSVAPQETQSQTTGVTTKVMSSTQDTNEMTNDQGASAAQDDQQALVESKSAVAPQAATPQNGWQTDNESSYYYKDGQKVIGQQSIDGKNYYFNDQGQQQKNYFLNQANRTYYFQADGTRLDDGFYNNWGHTYYFQKDGSRLDNGFYNNWGHTYYFGQGGMRLDDGFYNNWGHTYYFQKDGSRLDNGFYNNWGHTYYFGQGGMRLDDGFYNNWGHTYYFQKDGSRLDNGFYNNWGHTYYFGNDGARWDNRFMNNWGHLYYFGHDGALVTNQFVQHNGQTYYALPDGILNAPKYFSQFTPIYAPEGCAVASLAMLLSIKNKYFNLANAYNNLPQYGGVYNTGAFRGIISPDALTRYAHNWDSNVQNITGASLTEVSKLVWAGHPVLYYGMSSFERAGQRNHAKVIVGENNGYFHIFDPCYWGQGQRAHTAGGNAYDWGADSWQSWGAVASEYIGRAITIY